MGKNAKRITAVLLLAVALLGRNSFNLFKTQYDEKRLFSTTKTGISTEFDTGYFYQSIPRNGEYQIQEVFLKESKSTNKEAINRDSPQPNNPFDGDIFVPNVSFLQTYYSHLSENMPRNVLGICGYTGISMFLSFYDAYWNDDFIFEQYDSETTNIQSTTLYSSNAAAYESPGVWNNIDSSSPDINALINQIDPQGIMNHNSIEFKEALDRKIMEQVFYQIDSDTFLGKLFRLAIDNGSIEPHFDEEEYHGYVNGIGVNNTIMNSVLQDYIDDNSLLRGRISLITSKMLDDTELERQRIRSEIVEIVSSGRPVLLGGNGYDDLNQNHIQDANELEFGHVVVAYDYDENNNILYGNMGWSSSTQTHVNLDAFFNLKMTDYWALNISSLLPKNQTDNYIFNDESAYFSPGTNRLFNKIKPSNYGFPEYYGNGSEINSKVVTLVDTNESFTTNRVRCGFIEGQCINISTKRYSPGIGYLEYVFNRSIARMEVQLSWWSANEQITSSDSDYRIECLTSSNTYYELVDLWHDTTLSTNRLTPTIVQTVFPLNTNCFRFYGTVNDPLCDRNKGRLSIFNLIIIYA